MPQRLRWAILALSGAALAGISVAAIRSSGNGRVDLVGPPVRRPAPPISRPVITTPPARIPVIVAMPPPSTRLARPTAAVPRRIIIPTLRIDADVVSVGKKSDGSMAIPGAAEAGWYQPGPRPGDPFGSAVIAAHVDHGGLPGVFIDLARLELGADVEVTDQSGSAHRFVVTERFQVDKDLLPSSELFRSDGSPTLTLITCGGSYDRKHRHYADNIVIRAVPVG